MSLDNGTVLLMNMILFVTEIFLLYLRKLKLKTGFCTVKLNYYDPLYSGTVLNDYKTRLTINCLQHNT